MTEPPPLSMQVGDAVLAAQEDRLEVDVLHALPRLDDVSSTGRRRAARSRVVEEHVDAPVLATHALVDPAHRVLVGDVDLSERSTSGDGLRSTPTTDAPSARNSVAVSAPMPLAVPVMTQTFPSSRPGIAYPSVETKIVLTSV
jgi:hypothetical protein